SRLPSPARSSTARRTWWRSAVARRLAMSSESIVLIEAALNGGRDRGECSAVPYTAAELAAEARRCADEGAAFFHVHARAADGGWTADAARYGEVVRGLCKAVPEGL